LVATKSNRPPKRAKQPVTAASVEPRSTPAARSRQHREFALKKAAFEIVIVTVGVLLALIVDEARQSRADRALAEEARTAMRAEIDQNRVRLASKLTLLHQAYQTLQQNSGAGPALVGRPSNFQIAMTDAAWTMAVQTGALRHIPQQERETLVYLYTSQDIYNQLLAEEMNHWTALATAGPGDAAVKLWMAYAQRVGISVCIATIRIERFRNPRLPTARLQPVCQRYRLSIPPAQLYRAMGVQMPNTSWRPGSEF
jgi:hypothetical protein